jgi:hypothetical protein
MFKRSKTLRVFLLTAVVLSMTAFAFGDTIRLKTGSMVKGKITGFRGGRFTITIGEGTRKRTLAYSAEEVDSIEFDQTATVASYVSRPAAPPVVEPTPAPTPEPVAQTQVSRSEPVADSTQQSATRRPTNLAHPVELNVKVLADNTANGWTNTGWVVKRGQRIHISGDGEVSLGRGNTTTASGRYDLDDADKLMKAVPTGALIAVIGDDNNDFLYIGSDREITAARDGILFLGLNEGNLNDNTGSFAVKIQISPEGS